MKMKRTDYEIKKYKNIESERIAKAKTLEDLVVWRRDKRCTGEGYGMFKVEGK